VRISVLVSDSCESVQVSPHLNESKEIHQRHFIQAGLQGGLLLYDSDGDSLCTRMCISVCVCTWDTVHIFECGCMHLYGMCLPMPTFSGSISVSPATVFPVLNVIDILSSSGCSLKSLNLICGITSDQNPAGVQTKQKEFFRHTIKTEKKTMN